jgi:CBS domain containing-hemolysin-like protein
MTIAGSEHLAEVYTTAILTPVLFIFGEVLPKNIYFSIPDKAMPPSAWLSMASKKIFTACGIIPLLKLLTLLAEKIAGLSRTTEKLITTARKLEILEIIRQTHEEGILGRVPAALIDRFVSVSQIQTGSAATPISKVNLVNIKTSHSQLIEKLKTCDEQYWLVYNDFKIVGYIDIYQTLNCGRDFSELTDFIKPLLEISEQKSMAEALDMITSEKIILVTRKSILPERKTPMGLFTLNELIEEIAASTKTAG